MDYLKLVSVNVIPERFKTDGYDDDEDNNNNSNNNNANIVRMLDSYTQNPVFLKIRGKKAT